MMAGRQARAQTNVAKFAGEPADWSRVLNSAESGDVNSYCLMSANEP